MKSFTFEIDNLNILTLLNLTIHSKKLQNSKKNISRSFPCDLLNTTDLPVQLNVIFNYTNWDPHSLISCLTYLPSFTYMRLFTFGIEIIKSTLSVRIYNSLFTLLLLGKKCLEQGKSIDRLFQCILCLFQTICQVYQTRKIPFRRRGYKN